MEKTKVLLAFGMHGTNKRSPKKFFRDSVVSFLEEEVVKGGNRADIIHEYVYT